MRRLLVLVGVVLLILVGSAAAAPEVGANHFPLPPCPQVEGWSALAPRAPNVDSELSTQFTCEYAKAGTTVEFSMFLVWLRPAAVYPRDGIHKGCIGAADDVGSYYRNIYSKTHSASLEYRAGGGSDYIAIWRSEQERFTRAALVLLAATESLAKPCPSQASPTTTGATIGTISRAFRVKTTVTGWVNTGFDLRSGVAVTLTTAGNGSCSPTNPAICPAGNPNGVGKLCREYNAANGPGGNLPFGSVVGKIGARGTPLLVGKGPRTVKGQGRLYLAYNDCAGAMDNAGTFTVTARWKR